MRWPSEPAVRAQHGSRRGNGLFGNTHHTGGGNTTRYDITKKSTTAVQAHADRASRAPLPATFFFLECGDLSPLSSPVTVHSSPPIPAPQCCGEGLGEAR